MIETAEILKVAAGKALHTSLDLIYTKEQHIPGSVNYSVKRYYSLQKFTGDDTGMLIYSYDENKKEGNYFELRFCVSGNKFCFEKQCENCAESPVKNCSSNQETLDVFSFQFSSTFLNQFVHNVKLSNRKDEVLAFKYPHSFTKIFPVCSRKRLSLDALLTHTYSGSLENIYTNAKVHELLLYSLECLIDEKEEGFACKFLADEAGRERIYLARDILLKHIGEPITIKALSRKVAMNECYLKKGFKEIFGTTIFEFFQQQRMEHAKYLLYEKSFSVTDVSASLGYSSISHFSAAFKKHTGLKPCELLR